MKEIKAYFRPEKADNIIFELERAGLNRMTIIDVSTEIYQAVIEGFRDKKIEIPGPRQEVRLLNQPQNSA